MHIKRIDEYANTVYSQAEQEYKKDAFNEQDPECWTDVVNTIKNHTHKNTAFAEETAKSVFVWWEANKNNYSNDTDTDVVALDMQNAVEGENRNPKLFDMFLEIVDYLYSNCYVG